MNNLINIRPQIYHTNTLQIPLEKVKCRKYERNNEVWLTLAIRVDMPE